MSPLVSVSGLSKTFKVGGQSTQALANVSLDISAGEFVCIVGPSGCGKSTLLHCIGGLLEADEGCVSICDRDVTSASSSQLAELRRGFVSYVFQDLNLISSLTVADNVRVSSLFAGKKPSRRDVVAVLEAVGLAEKANAYPSQLSGGQRQRVAIARAVLRAPSVLLADEPTAALDRQSSFRALELLKSTVNPQSALVLVTHDLEIAARAHRVIVLDSGTVWTDLRNPSVEAIFQAMREASASQMG